VSRGYMSLPIWLANRGGLTCGAPIGSGLGGQVCRGRRGAAVAVASGNQSRLISPLRAPGVAIAHEALHVR
jgi:hypothetical protein